MMFARVRLAAAMVVTAMALTTAAMQPADAAATGYRLDRTDPAQTGCATGAYSFGGRNLYSSNGTRVAYMEVRYSPKCLTNWVRVYNYTYIGDTLKSIQRKQKPSVWVTTPDTTHGWTYSMQVYAPGSTCVYVGVALLGKPGSGVGIISQTPELKFC